jgi:hypothetical protein
MLEYCQVDSQTDIHAYPPTIRLADIATHSPNKQSASAPRRIRVLLNVAGSQIMRGHTVDVAVDRLSISVPSAIELDQECAVFFGLTIDDQIYSIIGKGRIQACTPNPNGGYRADMTFEVADKKSRIALEQLFGSSESACVQ